MSYLSPECDIFVLICFSERAAINLQLLCDCCDLVMPTSSLGWTGLDDGIIGIAGTTSSLIGLYGAWKKTA